MGPGLALTVLERAGRVGDVDFSEWMRLFRIVASPEALIAQGYDDEVGSQAALAHNVGVRMCVTARTFEERSAAIDALIECDGTGDQSQTLIGAKHETIRGMVADADTLERIERVHELLNRAGKVWHTTLATGSTMPHFRSALRRRAVGLATTCSDWYNIAKRIKGPYQEWHEALEGMIRTAGDSALNWSLIYKEAVRVRDNRITGLALEKLVSLAKD